MSYLINPYMVSASSVTWENLTTDAERDIIINDNYAYAQVVDTSIVSAGNITNVQFDLQAGTSSGTLHCCRWDDRATMDTGNGAACLAASNHTYWSIAASAPNGMTSETVSASTPCVTDETIGIVVTGGGVTQVTKLRVTNPRVVGFPLMIHCDVASASQDLDRTATFTITAG